jgi:hypothetical protein
LALGRGQPRLQVREILSALLGRLDAHQHVARMDDRAARRRRMLDMAVERAGDAHDRRVDHRGRDDLGRGLRIAGDRHRAQQKRPAADAQGSELWFKHLIFQLKNDAPSPLKPGAETLWEVYE